jgi:hypothetical protein
MRSVIEIVTFGQDTSAIQRWNPVRPFLVWYYGRYLDSCIHSELEKRFKERKASFDSKKQQANDSTDVKSLGALAWVNYMSASKKQASASLNEDFKSYATAQLRLFLVAGHDTTSSAITYTLHLLHMHPDYLARMEHDEIFGAHIAETTRELVKNPDLLNQLPLTLAAIKESLWLFPPAGGIRMGWSEIILTAEDGTSFLRQTVRFGFCMKLCTAIPHTGLNQTPIFRTDSLLVRDTSSTTRMAHGELLRLAAQLHWANAGIDRNQNRPGAHTKGI